MLGAVRHCGPLRPTVWSERKRMAAGDQLADWGFGETLAYASLLMEGHPIRLSGPGDFGTPSRRSPVG